MEDEAKQATRPDTTDAQSKKLQLEVQELEKRLRTKTSFKESLIKSLPLLTALLAIASFWFGIFQFYSEREKEFKKPLWEKQLNFYLEATKSTATLATFKEDNGDEARKEWEKARIRFWQLYYGELVVVEDKSVSEAMVHFGKCLRDYDLGHCDQQTLMDSSLALAQVCRDSVSRSWREPLGTVQR